MGADAWLNREPSMRAMRRSAHAAASGRAMAMPRDGAELVGTAQAIAAAAVLAVISIAIVPHAFAEVSSRVAVATVAEFVCGYLLS